MTTLLTRPYVFIFLIAFLFLSIRSKGIGRTLIFLVTGYLIAWSSEALSIRTGFPYGWYFYIYENLQGEWLNAGVPVWDSLSYVFLCYAGLCVAEYVFDRRWKYVLYGALFTTILDIVIDPIAHLGDQWFLGKIYYYPNPGFYFDIPLTNFAGWFLVSFLIIGLNQLIPAIKQKEKLGFINSYGGLSLYFGVLLFNWIITLSIGQYGLALSSLCWMIFPLVLVNRRSNS